MRTLQLVLDTLGCGVGWQFADVLQAALHGLAPPTGLAEAAPAPTHPATPLPRPSPLSRWLFPRRWGAVAHPDGSVRFCADSSHILVRFA